MNRIFWMLLAGSAIAATPDGGFSPLSRTGREEPRSVSTEVGTVGEFQKVTQRKLQNWERRIRGLKRKAQTSGRTKEQRLQATASRLEQLREGVRAELKRMSEEESPVTNQTAEAAIDRSFREMEQIFSANQGPAPATIVQ
jgi:hypothetical protein